MDDLIMDRLYKKAMKQLNNKPGVRQILPRRAFNISFYITQKTSDIPFEELSLYLYLYANANDDDKIKKFTRHYERQLEYAKSDPENFVFNLHRFYQTISKEIKKENLYSDFFKFYSSCVETYFNFINNDIEPNKKKVIECYMSLLSQNFDYLKKDQFSFKTILVGVTTYGELIEIPEAFPYFDTPVYAIEDLALHGKIVTTDEITKAITREFKKHGYDNIKTMQDMHHYAMVDRLYTNMSIALSPFINEYTFDILPQKPFMPNTDILKDLHSNIDYHQLALTLHKRKRTLPPNGYLYKFNKEDSFLETLFLKEVNVDDTIYMLYKIETSYGDLVGYYNTSSEFFLNMFDDSQEVISGKIINAIVLLLYAISVCKTYTEDDFSSHIKYKDTAINVKGYSIGGKLRNVYDQYQAEDNDLKSHSAPKRVGNEKYATETKTIQGYIRKVGEGRTPSPEAVAYAQKLGYDLDPDETYVRPFIKQVLKLKENIDTTID